MRNVTLVSNPVVLDVPERTISNVLSASRQTVPNSLSNRCGINISPYRHQRDNRTQHPPLESDRLTFSPGQFPDSI